MREEFEKETGIKLKPATGSGLLWQEYAEWQDKRVKDLLEDMWYLLQCAKNKSELFKHEYDQYENKIKRMSEITPPDEAKRGRG